MSKARKAARELLVPSSYGNRLHFPWLIIFREGQDSRAPTYFLTAGQNFSKFADREAEGFRIIGHVKLKNDAQYVCSEMNAELKGGKPKGTYQLSVTKSEAKLNSGKLWIPPKYRK